MMGSYSNYNKLSSRITNILAILLLMFCQIPYLVIAQPAEIKTIYITCKIEDDENDWQLKWKKILPDIGKLAELYFSEQIPYKYWIWKYSENANYDYDFTIMLEKAGIHKQSLRIVILAEEKKPNVVSANFRTDIAVERLSVKDPDIGAAAAVFWGKLREQLDPKTPPDLIKILRKIPIATSGEAQQLNDELSIITNRYWVASDMDRDISLDNYTKIYNDLKDEYFEVEAFPEDRNRVLPTYAYLPNTKSNRLIINIYEYWDPPRKDRVPFPKEKISEYITYIYHKTFLMYENRGGKSVD